MEDNVLMELFKKYILCLIFLLFSQQLFASTDEEVKAIVDAEKPPVGVVFDVDEWDNEALTWAVPAIEQYVQQLHARFPGLKIAIVSHGDEEFALMRRARNRFSGVHTKVKSLVDNDVQFYVCAGHALMNGQSERDFVEFVKPVPAGVVKVADYRRQGYVYIRVQQSH